ncbi:ATP-binding protein [Sphaerisporangium rhizosphaerae]|uniref:ATP-binding protein n=1 Tax=Sphaerisporangium rhizosphaerae TaxID=2269375 RepID=A0ABW2PEV6_9ACTN
MNGISWRREFAGRPAEIREVRRFISGVLLDNPVHDDALSCAVELASNAVRHTRSGQGGVFAVELLLRHEIIRIAVTDAGGPTIPSERSATGEDLLEGGRGLTMVAALGARLWVEGDETGRTVWVELAWTAPIGQVSIESGTWLTEFLGWKVWYGQATGNWWAVPSQRLPLLLEASSPVDLARGISVMEGSSHPVSWHADDRH